MDKFYCKNCKQLFNDIQNTRFRNKVIDYRSGELIKWLRSILFNEQHKIRYIKQIFIVNCPHCMSKDTINATEIEIIMQDKKLCGLNQYTKEKEKLYIEVLKVLKSTQQNL